MEANTQWVKNKTSRLKSISKDRVSFRRRADPGVGRTARAREADQHLCDSRQGLNKKFPLADLLRQSTATRRLDLNDARVAADPTFRLIGSQKNWDRGGALTSGYRGQGCSRVRRICWDWNRSRKPRHGRLQRVGWTWTRPRARFTDSRKAVPTTGTSSPCYHPLEPARRLSGRQLRPGNVHSADDWDFCRRSSANRLRANRSPSAAMRPLLSRRFILRRNAECSSQSHSGQQELGRDRRHLVSPAGKALPEALGALQEFSLSGGELVAGEADRRPGRT